MNWKIEITAEEQKKEKRMKKIEDSLGDLLDNIKCTNSQIIGVPEKKRKRKGVRKYLKRLQLKSCLTWEKKPPPMFRKPREKPKRNTQRKNLNKQ